MPSDGESSAESWSNARLNHIIEFGSKMNENG